MRHLQDEHVVVTGGSRGLGVAIVEALVAREARVTVVARDRPRLAEVKRLGVTVRTYRKSKSLFRPPPGQTAQDG